MTDIPYVLGIPASSHNPSNDQPDMQANNDAVSSILAVDHYTFNNSNSGFHQWSTYLDQGSDPGSPVGSVREYAKSVGGSSELFMERDSVATPIQLTSGTIVSNSASGPVTVPVVTYSSFQTFLPGGILMKTGTISYPGGATLFPYSVTFASLGLTNFPNGVLGYFSSSSHGGDPISSVSTTGFTTGKFIGFVSVLYWTVIGY